MGQKRVQKLRAAPPNLGRLVVEARSTEVAHEPLGDARHRLRRALLDVIHRMVQRTKRRVLGGLVRRRLRVAVEPFLVAGGGALV